MLTILRHHWVDDRLTRAITGLLVSAACLWLVAPCAFADDDPAEKNPRSDDSVEAIPDVFPSVPVGPRNLFDQPRPSAARPPVRAVPPHSARTGEAVDPELAKKWVAELADDNYRRRESAAKNLIKAGASVVPFVAPSLESGDLEITHSVINILHEIALAQPPTDSSGAWSHLQQLAQHGSGSRQTRSAEAVEEIREYRSGQAVQALKKAGVYVGPDEFVVRAISAQKRIVQIDENWNGDLEAIGWLRWLRGIEYARIKGPAIRREVFEKLSETVDLTTIAIVDGTITPDVLQPLTNMMRIHSLEFRYVPLDQAMVRPIMDLPIRVSLSLTGTGIPKTSVVAMREALPGLQIDCKEGGFLGVTCQQAFNDCQIQSVMPDSSADKAGLMAMDVVVGIDDDPVQRFEDLQQAIGMHFPGDEVTVKFRRGGQEQSVVVKLGKLKER